jgi:hypothetical protein
LLTQHVTQKKITTLEEAVKELKKYRSYLGHDKLNSSFEEMVEHFKKLLTKNGEVLFTVPSYYAPKKVRVGDITCPSCGKVF